MKTTKNLSLAMLALLLFAIPVSAQKNESNKGAALHGDARADHVQADKRKDKDRDRSRDNDMNKGKHNGETKGKHNAKGHSH